MKTLFSTLFFLLIFALAAPAQSLLEAAGGVKTHFTFTTADKDMGVEAQILIRRAIVKTVRGIDEAFAYGAEAFFLELVSKEKIKTKKENGKKDTYYILKFYNAQDQLLAEYRRDEELLSIKSNEQKPSLYITAIDLRQIPVVFLENTQRIEITRYWVDKSHEPGN